MKYTTAKTILKIYRKEGRFGKKKQRLKKGYVKACTQSLPTDKHASVGGGSTGGHCDQGKEEPFTPFQQYSQSVLCSGTFWGSRIAEHCI